MLGLDGLSKRDPLQLLPCIHLRMRFVDETDTFSLQLYNGVCTCIDDVQETEVGFAQSSRAEADVGTDGSPTRSPGRTELHEQHVTSVMLDFGCRL